MTLKLRILLALGGALAALSACSSAGENGSDGPDEPKGALMNFSVSAPSRAEVTAEQLTAVGSAFKVYGSYVNSSSPSARVTEFDGVTVTRGEKGWTYDSPRYWFPGQTYDFTALYPPATPATMDPNTGKVTVAGFTTDGTDLMAAGHIRQTTGVSGQGAVTLTFAHLLGRVRITGRTDDRFTGGQEAREVKVTSLRILGVATRGSWTGANLSTIPSGAWTPEPAAADVVAYSAIIPDGGVILGNDPVSFSFYADGGSLLVLPQTLANATVEVTYSYTAGNLPTFTEAAPITGNWQGGKSYSYSFSINTHIFFDAPKVEDWTTAPVNGNDFNIDLTTNQ